MKPLNTQQLRFVELYLQTVAAGKPNAAQSYIRAGYKCSQASAEAAGSRLLNDVRVQQLLRPAKVEMAATAQAVARVEQVHGIVATREAVLERFLAAATADPNELVELRRTCCRYCYGAHNRYQRTRGEMERDRASYDLEAAKARRPPPPFDELGGIGYDPRKAPHENCPECFGEGVERAFPKDTRHLSFAARCLYAGLKVTKDGVEIKTHDQQAALVNVGKMLGAFTPEKDDGPAGGGVTNVNVTVVNRIDQFAAAFAGAADREEAGAVPGHGAGQPLAAGADQGRSVQ